MKENDKVNIYKEALALKKKGLYIESLSEYGKILQIDKYDYFAYQGIAKIYFLLNDKDASVRNYLIAIHLQMLDDQERSMKDDTEASEIKEMLSVIPDEIQKTLLTVDSLAVFLYLNDNSSLHIAHALNDLVKSKYPPSAHKKKYSSALAGNDVEITKKYLEIENNFYKSIGLDFSLNMLDFKLNKKDILNTYFLIPYSLIEKTYIDLYKKYVK